MLVSGMFVVFISCCESEAHTQVVGQWTASQNITIIIIIITIYVIHCKAVYFKFKCAKS